MPYTTTNLPFLMVTKKAYQILHYRVLATQESKQWLNTFFHLKQQSVLCVALPQDIMESHLSSDKESVGLLNVRTVAYWWTYTHGRSRLNEIIKFSGSRRLSLGFSLRLGWVSLTSENPQWFYWNNNILVGKMR